MTPQDYVIWYYFKYRVSKKRLLKKLREKYSDLDFSSLDFSFLDQEQDLFDLIRGYQTKNKSIFYIRGKLFERLYEKDLIEKVLFEFDLESYEEEALRNLLKNSLQTDSKKLIKSLLDKGFSYGLVKKTLV